MNNVAMLIDWENIKASAINSLRTPPDIITLKKIARKYGSSSYRTRLRKLDRLRRMARRRRGTFVGPRH